MFLEIYTQHYIPRFVCVCFFYSGGDGGSMILVYDAMSIGKELLTLRNIFLTHSAGSK